MSNLNLSPDRGKAIRSAKFGEASSCLAILFFVVTSMLVASCGTAGASSSGGGNALVVSGNFPGGDTAHSYNAVLNVNGGTAPYQFSLGMGTLPPGLKLHPSTGSISGTPSAAGTYSFEVLVTDAPGSARGLHSFQIAVADAKANVKVSVSPASANLNSSDTAQFNATVSGTSNTGVTWSASAGTISKSGLFTAPAVTSQLVVAVTATSAADTAKSAVANVVVSPAAAKKLSITSGNPPDGQVNNSYGASFTASGGSEPYSWAVSSGKLPTGISLSKAGEISGTPTATGSFNFGVTVTDKASRTAQGSYGINITASGSFDGPAELPRRQVSSAMSDTPTPGTVLHVPASSDPQVAINAAHCGDVIELQAGATYDKNLYLPNKSCDDQHWIVIRTSAADNVLPAEGQRATPCYAGVASLPNRPAYGCSKTSNVFAKITHSVHMGTGPIVLQEGANHYRLVGLEITRNVDKVPVVALIGTVKDGKADHIVVDRSWVHGTAQDETRRGFALRGTTDVAIVDSYFNDFHCTSISGTCTDSSAMGGGAGNNPSGPWKIENNFLEAAGENILFGGGAATIVPSDITIRHNHFYKVPQWQPGSHGFVGGYGGDPFVVKNHLEIKNGSHILIENNLFEYSWGGFSQFGHSILITPRNDYEKDTHRGNLCSVCEATDIVVRFNKISHVAAGMNIANAIVHNQGATAGERYSIHDIVLDDLDGAQYRGGGSLFLVMNNWPNQTLNNVSIRHITGFPDPTGHMMSIMNNLHYPQMYGFTFQDNLIVVPTYPVWSAGGVDNCAVADVPVTVIAKCFKTYTFSTNVLSSVTKAFPPEKWPSGNSFPATADDIKLVNYNNGSGGDYHLQASSPYKGKASDGKDPGADIDAVNAALEGVE
jgi:Putative Ig domain